MGIWNELAEEIVESGTITTFKIHLDRRMNKTGLVGHEPNVGKWTGLVGMDELGCRAHSILYDAKRDSDYSAHCSLPAGGLVDFDG